MKGLLSARCWVKYQSEEMRKLQGGRGRGGRLCPRRGVREGATRVNRDPAEGIKRRSEDFSLPEAAGEV